jgi:hypothetical protein
MLVETIAERDIDGPRKMKLPVRPFIQDLDQRQIFVTTQHAVELMAIDVLHSSPPTPQTCNGHATKPHPTAVFVNPMWQA